MSPNEFSGENLDFSAKGSFSDTPIRLVCEIMLRLPSQNPREKRLSHNVKERLTQKSFI